MNIVTGIDILLTSINKFTIYQQKLFTLPCIASKIENTIDANMRGIGSNIMRLPSVSLAYKLTDTCFKGKLLCTS